MKQSNVHFRIHYANTPLFSKPISFKNLVLFFDPIKPRLLSFDVIQQYDKTNQGRWFNTKLLFKIYCIYRFVV